MVAYGVRLALPGVCVVSLFAEISTFSSFGTVLRPRFFGPKSWTKLGPVFLQIAQSLGWTNLRGRISVLFAHMLQSGQKDRWKNFLVQFFLPHFLLLIFGLRRQGPYREDVTIADCTYVHSPGMSQSRRFHATHCTLSQRRTLSTGFRLHEFLWYWRRSRQASPTR